jgi:hypothetical protein
MERATGAGDGERATVSANDGVRVQNISDTAFQDVSGHRRQVRGFRWTGHF